MLVKGRQVVTEDGMIKADVLIENGAIARIEVKLRSKGETVDARACRVLPSVIDPHVQVLPEGHHMLEPTLDDLEEASRVGLFGGRFPSRGFQRDVIRGGVRVIANGEMFARAPARYLSTT